MATPRREHHRLVGLLLLGAIAAQGCQTAGSRAPRDPLAAAHKGERTRRVTAKQAADVQFAQGRVDEARGDLAAAEASYRRALESDHTRGDAVHRLAIVLDRQGKFAESEPFYQKVRKAQPKDPDLLCDIGYSLGLQGRAKEAEAALRQALAIAPDHARAHNNLGLVLARAGRGEAALGEFRAAGNDEADARSNLALSLAVAGRPSESRAEYRRALAANPASKAAGAGLRAVETVAAKGKATIPSLPPPRDGAVLPASYAAKRGGSRDPRKK